MLSFFYYCMEDAEAISFWMNPMEDQHTNYDQVLEKFDVFFKGRKKFFNMIALTSTAKMTSLQNSLYFVLTASEIIVTL